MPVPAATQAAFDAVSADLDKLGAAIAASASSAQDEADTLAAAQALQAKADGLAASLPTV